MRILARTLAPAFIMLLALLAGCISSEPKLAPLAPDAVILAFGDSLTHGTGSSGLGQSVARRAYPHQLELLTGLRVINAGAPGETSARGVKRLPLVLAQFKPDLVILCHGGNDLLKQLPEEQLKANIASMIRMIRSSGAEVLMVGVPTPGLLLKTHSTYLQLAEDMNVPLERAALSEVLADGGLKSDLIHPNAIGYRALALKIRSALARFGALPSLDAPGK